MRKTVIGQKNVGYYKSMDLKMDFVIIISLTLLIIFVVRKMRRYWGRDRQEGDEERN